MRIPSSRATRTLNQAIGKALRQSLSVSKEARRRRVRLPTFRGDGMQPGVNIDDSAGLLSLMEESPGRTAVVPFRPSDLWPRGA